jgi:hypothetical protein
MALRTGRRLAGRTGAAAAIAAIVALSGSALAQARPNSGSPSARDGGVSTAFVHQIQWSSTFPTRGVTLLSGVYSDPSVTPSRSSTHRGSPVR